MGDSFKKWLAADAFNKLTYNFYYDRLLEMSLARYEWLNLPDSVDARFLELTLFKNGRALFFEDDVLGMLALPVIINGPFNVYKIPIRRRAFTPGVSSVNETDKSTAATYQAERTNKDSVICYNNMLHSPSLNMCRMFARRLADIDRTIDVNISAQKTPVLIESDANTLLSLKNAYKQYEGNFPVIFGKKGIADNVKVLMTGAPLVAPALQQLKQTIWNDAMEALGIANHGADKKERVNILEIQANQGGTIASRYSGLIAREQACDAVNRMFGTSISVRYREEVTPESFMSEQDGGGEDE
jgi:hypothetical protein|nr:MAG TPA_asm: upper collar protein [Caudoviricetes sp.]